jgi:tetratricopeptide (TPR) repeat protein
LKYDISDLLDQWEYKPGQVLVRKFKGKDGQEKIQLRLDLGLLQMNAAGRPDGKRPFGAESLLEHYETQLIRHLEENDGSDEGFELKSEDCSKLQQEAIQFHHRYICLFHLGEYEGVLRDTDRNLKVFDFVELYAETDELAWSLQQFRPQLLMMQTRARAAQKLEENHYEEAIKLIQNGLEEIREFYTEQSRHDLLEQSGEIQSLEVWMEEIQTQRPMSEQEKLEQALKEAVHREDYEKAAQVRDQLRTLTGSTHYNSNSNVTGSTSSRNQRRDSNQTD